MAICKARLVIVAMAVILAGCATPERAPDPPPPVYVPESTWQQVDHEIGAASAAARQPAENYARGSMKAWLARVRQRTEADFIPWYTGYWTQQWLAIKVAWYKMSAGQEKDTAVERLAAYLQEQYQERVLGPVATEIDPDAVRGQATKLYVQLLGEQIQAIPRRYGVPLDQFDRRLKEIPAIVLPPPAAHRASLYQTVHALPINELPAYVALLARIAEEAGAGGSRAIECQNIAGGETGQRKAGRPARRQRRGKRCRGGSRRRRRRGDFAGRGRHRRDDAREGTAGNGSGTAGNPRRGGPCGRT